MKNESWHQYGLIAYLADKMQAIATGFGKTKLQKLIFLLKELKGISTGYRFHFYTYGPYSGSLSGDLDYLDAIGGVSVTYDSLNNIYNIAEGENTSRFIKKAEDFLRENSSNIDQVIEEFGDKQAKELELIATIVYVANFGKNNESHEEEIINQVGKLKPKFDPKTIKSALKSLKDAGYIETASN